MQFFVTTTGRLDAALSTQETGLSRQKLQAAIKAGSVTVNGTVVTKAASKLQIGDEVTLNEECSMQYADSEIKAIDQNLTVLYEDAACMVLNKPAGIAVHPGNAMDPTEETLLSGIRFLFEERQILFSENSVLVHRLDKPTTGCILVAKDDKSFAALQKQFEQRETTKRYLAIVAGVPEHKRATIDAPIGRNLTDRTKMSILQTSTSRPATTDYEVLDATTEAALLLCTLHSGRTHQIRVHLSSIKHPLLGDGTYGTPASEAYSEQLHIDSLCLHAWQLGFVSPDDKQAHDIRAPLPASFYSALSAAQLTAGTL